eukprot:gene13621-19499_t
MDGCLVKTQADIQVELHPSKLGNVADGVKEFLYSQLLRYTEDYSGVPLSFSNIKILRRKAPVHSYFPLVHLNVKAESLIFRPQVGATLEGSVTKMGTDFIGLLVMGVFNASILADSIRSDFKSTNFRGDIKWQSKKTPEHQITVGTTVRFKVLRGGGRWLLDVDATPAKKKKEKKKSKSTPAGAGEDGVSEKKKKKRKSMAVGEADGQVHATPGLEGTEKKKKEKKVEVKEEVNGMGEGTPAAGVSEKKSEKKKKRIKDEGET